MIVGHPRRISPKMTHDHGSPCGPSAVGGEKTRSARSVSPAYPGPEGGCADCAIGPIERVDCAIGIFGFGRATVRLSRCETADICGSLAP